MKKLLGAAVATAAIALGSAPAASANSDSYFYTLEHDYGWVIWDYPGNLATGLRICDLLWNDVNPIPWLTQTVGYQGYEAADLIVSARINLCPGNAVTAPPPQLQYAT